MDNTMNKRQREPSPVIDCEILNISQRKIRKIMPFITDECVDLTSDDSNDSQTIIESTEVSVENNQHRGKISNVIKSKEGLSGRRKNGHNLVSCKNGIEDDHDELLDINNSGLMRELCTEYTDEDVDNLIRKNSVASGHSSMKESQSSKEVISQDSAIFTANSGLNTASIHFSESIDDLLTDSDDDNTQINSDPLREEDDSICKTGISPQGQNTEISSNSSLVKDKSSDKRFTSQNSTEVISNLESNSCVTHFSQGIDDLLSETSDEGENDNKNDTTSITKNSDSVECNSSLPKKHKTQWTPSKSQEQSSSQNSTDITADSGLPASATPVLEDLDDILCDDWDDEDFGESNIKNTLDLSEFTRCKIIRIDRKLRYIDLTVSDPELPNTAVVQCAENWRDLIMELGEFVIIKAKYSELENKWVINNDYGMCVTQPDTLVPGTAVVSGLFCNRRGILQNIYTGIDCLPNVEPNNAALTCGSITHELLQTALEEKVYSLHGIWKLLDRILKLPSTILLLYVSDLTIKQFKEMISEYIPKIYEFISRFIEGNKPEQWDDNFAGKIESVRDIEENVWLPKLGLKGKIDATVEVTLHERRGIMPLEIKTGRSSFSIEHKGQVYLYIMMMQMLGYDLSSGLLLYIKENIMQEIKSTRNEERDLILMRNMMAHYLTRESTISNKSDDSSPMKWTKWKLPGLPEPIHHRSACKQCTFNTICCVYAKDDENLSLSDNHPHSKLQKTILRDLTPEHIDYVVNWISLIQMESSFQKNAETDYAIWSHTPTKREQRRTCLSYMALQMPIVLSNDMYLHKFIRDPNEKSKHLFPIDDFRKVFVVDDYVMVSTDIRMNIVSGCVAIVAKNSISVLFAKDISKWNNMSYYHIDEFPSTSLPYRALGGIAAMLADNDITRRLRRIIIDKEPATFTNSLPNNTLIGTGAKIMNQLNYYQQEALKAVITSTHFVLIKGMPGTGKTQTLVALIEMLSYLGHSVLITAHTHMAVDNVLQKLNEKDIDFLRLGSKNRVHPSLHCKTDAALIDECETPDQLDARYRKKNIVAVTCLGAHHALLSKRIFDYCVVDECTQALQPILLRPLYNAIKFVLVGDPEQLPAVVRCDEARKLGMNEDLFSRLDTANNTRMLKQQYRMNKPIMDLANRLTYDGELLVGNQQIANATLKWRHPEVFQLCEKWVRRTLCCKLENSVVMLNTKTTHNMHLTLNASNRMLERNDQSSRCSNYIEGAIILRLLNVLIEAGIRTDDIGVIAPYQAQLKLLKRVIALDIEINTVDQFQGRDKSVILLSCTRTGESDSRRRNKDDYEILSDHKRLNVALTRAKHKLIIVGDKISLLKFKPFRKLFDILDEEIIDLCDEIDDFSWHNLIHLIKENEKETSS